MTLYCPVGDGEFEDWIDRCTVCHRQLQDEPFNPNQYQNSDLVVLLSSAPNEPEAQLWANTLRNLDIAVFVRSGGPGVGAWASASSFEQDLMVRERDLVRAWRVVRDLFTSEAQSTGLTRIRRAAPFVNPARRPM